MKHYNIMLVMGIMLLTSNALLLSDGSNFGYGSFRRYTPKSSASPEHERHFHEFYDDLDDDDDVRL